MVTPSFLILRQNPQGLLQWLNFSPTLHLVCQEILIWNLATSYHSGLVILKHGPDHCLAQLLLRVTPAPSSECSLCSEFVHVFLLAPDTPTSTWTLDTSSISCTTPRNAHDCPLTPINLHPNGTSLGRKWKWKSKVLVTQSRLILFESSLDCSPPGSSVHGILYGRILEWVAILSSSGSSLPRDWTLVSCIAGGFYTASLKTHFKSPSRLTSIIPWITLLCFSQQNPEWWFIYFINRLSSLAKYKLHEGRVFFLLGQGVFFKIVV